MRQQIIGSCQIAGCGRDEWVTRAFCRRRGSGGQLRHSTDACRDPLSSRPEASMWRRRGLGDDDPSLIRLPCSRAPLCNYPPLPAASALCNVELLTPQSNSSGDPVSVFAQPFNGKRQQCSVICVWVQRVQAMWRRCLHPHALLYAPFATMSTHGSWLASKRKASSTLASRAHELSM
jgi:hypothetical protein